MEATRCTRDAIEILKKYGRGARQSGMNVPQAFHEFVWEYFLDGPPKTKSGPSPKDTELRKQAIRLLVKIVTEYGFNVSRNTEYRGSKAGPMTAQRLVAEEFGLDETTVTDLCRIVPASNLPVRQPAKNLVLILSSRVEDTAGQGRTL